MEVTKDYTFWPLAQLMNCAYTLKEWLSACGLSTNARIVFMKWCYFIQLNLLWHSSHRLPPHKILHWLLSCPYCFHEWCCFNQLILLWYSSHRLPPHKILHWLLSCIQGNILKAKIKVQIYFTLSSFACMFKN